MCNEFQIVFAKSSPRAPPPLLRLLGLMVILVPPYRHPSSPGTGDAVWPGLTPGRPARYARADPGRPMVAPSRHGVPPGLGRPLGASTSARERETVSNWHWRLSRQRPRSVTVHPVQGVLGYGVERRDAAHGGHAMPPAAVLPHAGTFSGSGRAVRLRFSTGGALQETSLEPSAGHRPSDSE